MNTTTSLWTGPAEPTAADDLTGVFRDEEFAEVWADQEPGVRAFGCPECSRVHFEAYSAFRCCETEAAVPVVYRERDSSYYEAPVPELAAEQELRELAAQADRLAQAVTDAATGLRTSTDGSARALGAHLVMAVTACRQAQDLLGRTAGDLEQLHSPGLPTADGIETTGAAVITHEMKGGWL